MLTVKEKRALRRAEKAKKNGSTSPDISEKLQELSLSSERNCTGVLTSHPLSRDVKVESFQLAFFGRELITSTNLELNFGRRYGLIGPNGSGKSTFLQALAAREIPIPNHIDIFLLDKEADPSDMTALETVIDEAVKEQKRLEKQAEDLAENATDDNVQVMLEDVYNRLDDMDPTTFESRAAELLHGLGFCREMMLKRTRDLSGGWRMRVALAKALFVKPTLLLLDEPTNHLDLEACVWLEDHLSQYCRILVIISHSQDFLNGVCTNIIHLNRTKLDYYTGDYSTYVKTRAELETNQMKAYEKQQADIEHIKKFIASCGTYANLVKQAKSKQKIIDKMVAAGLVEKVKAEPVFTFRFSETEKLPPPVLSFENVGFSYDGDMSKALYRKLDFGVDLDSRIALVGPNGVGKSTLLKIMCGELSPTEGRITRHCRLRIGRYHQHTVDQLDFEATPVEFMRNKYPDLNMEVESWRGRLGQFGLTGPQQMQVIRNLSDGQRSRLVFADLAQGSPNMLLLDEPTNHLDIECIDSLAEAIKAYSGGVVLVSHDFRLINQVAEEIWVVDQKTITKWEGDIQSYKTHLKKEMKKTCSL